MDTNLIKGIVVPIVTPVDENENIDEAKLRDQVNFVIDGGVTGILAFGSNGEFYMFDEAEMEEALQIILDETADRVPVYMGIGAIRTRNCIRIAKMAEKHGAFGISILQPMFLKPNEDELYKHFSSIALAVSSLPVLLYNNPGRCGYTLSANLVEKLARSVGNIVGMKDSSGDFTQMSEFVRRTRDIDFKVFAGKDTMIYAGLTIGTVGSVCTTANIFPELVCSIYDSYNAGNIEQSLELQFKLNPVRLVMDRASFPVATKDMANINSLDVGPPVLPNLPSNDEIIESFEENMRNAGVLNN